MRESRVRRFLKEDVGSRTFWCVICSSCFRIGDGRETQRPDESRPAERKCLQKGEERDGISKCQRPGGDGGVGTLMLRLQGGGRNSWKWVYGFGGAKGGSPITPVLLKEERRPRWSREWLGVYG